MFHVLRQKVKIVYQMTPLLKLSQFIQSNIYDDDQFSLLTVKHCPTVILTLSIYLQRSAIVNRYR